MIKDKVKVLGPNDGAVKLYMPDGFTTQQTIDEAGVENTRGAFFSVAGVPIDEFESESAAGLHHRRSRPSLGGDPVDPYAIYGAQAASGPARRDRGVRRDRAASVIEQMFATKVEGGFLGDFTFNENGDPVARERRSRRVHHLRGPGAARGGDGALAAGEVVDAARGTVAATRSTISGEGFGPPPDLIPRATMR